MLKKILGSFSIRLNKKIIRVSGAEDFIKVYAKLNPGDLVKGQLEEVMDFMKQDKNVGDYIKNKPWPKKYVDKHAVTNLYRCRIAGCRLIYTIRGDPDGKTYQLLDFLSHKKYDLLFGYATS
jgi:mRNA-degrading endonuclease RelE of RelBE toxin-antitoxin system